MQMSIICNGLRLLQLYLSVQHNFIKQYGTDKKTRLLRFNYNIVKYKLKRLYESETNRQRKGSNNEYRILKCIY